MEVIGILVFLAIVVFLVYRRSDTPTHRPPGRQPSNHSRIPVHARPPSHPRPLTKATKTNGVEHAPPPNIPTSRQLKGRAYIIDGDTIVVDKIKVRLAGIDAPELDQPWGQKSKWAMVKLCKGQTIRVELTGETSYDRLVGTCYLPDGRDIGEEIVKQGLALDGGHFSKGKYQHLEHPEIRRKLKNYGRWR